MWCFRYLDDIPLISDQKETYIGKALVEFNEQQPTFIFNTEKAHNSINFLDLSLQRREKDSNTQCRETHPNRCHNSQRLLSSM
jgi:hypothetical protein